MRKKSFFKAGAAGSGKEPPHARKGPKGARAMQKGRKGIGRRTERLIEQPVADSSDTVRCPVCGHPVDPQRMHPHMVRFHGVAIRARGAWAQSAGPATGNDE